MKRATLLEIKANSTVELKLENVICSEVFRHGLTRLNCVHAPVILTKMEIDLKKKKKVHRLSKLHLLREEDTGTCSKEIDFIWMQRNHHFLLTQD